MRESTFRVMCELAALPAQSAPRLQTLAEGHEGQKMVFGHWRDVSGHDPTTPEEHLAAAKHHHDTAWSYHRASVRRRRNAYDAAQRSNAPDDADDKQSAAQYGAAREAHVRMLAHLNQSVHHTNRAAGGTDKEPSYPNDLWRHNEAAIRALPSALTYSNSGDSHRRRKYAVPPPAPTGDSPAAYDPKTIHKLLVAASGESAVAGSKTQFSFPSVASPKELPTPPKKSEHPGTLPPHGSAPDAARMAWARARGQVDPAVMASWTRK